MNILAIDTSDRVLSVALAAETGVLCTELDAGMRHSELLMKSVDSLCAIAGIKPAQITHLACMKGPGSFTGLRIGFAAAKGMALALNIPLTAVPTLDCLAYPFSAWPALVLPAMDAKKGCFFAALYRGGQRLTDYLDASPQTLAQAITDTRLSPGERILLTGCGSELLYPRLADLYPAAFISIDPDPKRGRARELLKIARNATMPADDGNSGPVYLRKSDAELNAGKEQVSVEDGGFE